MDPNDGNWKDRYNRAINQWRLRRDAEYVKLRSWDRWMIAEICALYTAVNKFCLFRPPYHLVSPLGTAHPGRSSIHTYDCHNSLRKRIYFYASDFFLSLIQHQAWEPLIL